MMRQGDLFFAPVKKVPAKSRQVPHLTLAEGEITGHSHRIAESGTATLFARDEVFYVDVPEQARVIHEEHGTIDLPRGIYKVWRQREYTPTEIRPVYD